MNIPPEDLMECGCGHTFDIMSAEIRGKGGKWMNRELETNNIDPQRFEVQCPKCLLWMDAMTGDITL